jgi:hypothetical protein
MSLENSVKQNWERIQQQYDYPVDALGRPIDPNDSETLRVWRDEGLDQFVKR